MKYRKKPVVIEAVRFLGFDNLSNFSESPDWLLKAIYDDKKIKFFDEPNRLTIETLEGTMTADVGDYIIKGIQGELYPCKPDIFKQTYVGHKTMKYEVIGNTRFNHNFSIGTIVELVKVYPDDVLQVEGFSDLAGETVPQDVHPRDLREVKDNE